MEPHTLFGNLDILPPEVIQEFLIRLEPKDIIAWCQTGPKSNIWCESDQFWQAKYAHDFFTETRLIENDTWKDKYQRTFQILRSINPISVGFSHFGVIDRTGKLNMFGKKNKGISLRSFGPMGLMKTSDTKYNETITFPFKMKVISVACGDDHTTAITEDGSVYYWGWNSGNFMNFPKDMIIEEKRETIHGRKVFDQFTQSPMKVDIPGRGLKATAGRNTIGVIMDDNSVYMWGYILQSTENSSPLSPPTLINIKAIDLSIETQYFSAIGIDHQVYTWGDKFEFEPTPNGRVITTRYVQEPTLFPLPEKMKQIAVGDYYTVALSITGNVYAWGDNRKGQLGLGADSKQDFYPEPMKSPLIGIKRLSTGKNVTTAISKAGDLFMWGAGSNNRIVKRDQTKDIKVWTHYMFTDFPTPVKISISPDNLSVDYISVGENRVLAVTSDGIVNDWGEKRTF